MPRVKGNAVKAPIREDQMPTGTPEEMEEAWEKTEEYLYKILSYAPADPDKHITKEEREKEIRFLKFMRLGPRASYLRHAKDTKLTSADVLYILTCETSAKHLCALYDVSHETINGIRRGQFTMWAWEYYFVKRLRTMLRGEKFCYKNYSGKRGVKVYKIEELNKETGKLEIIGYASGIRRAKELRKILVPKQSFERFTKSKTLDIRWPITPLDIY